MKNQILSLKGMAMSFNHKYNVTDYTWEKMVITPANHSVSEVLHISSICHLSHDMTLSVTVE